jgi:transposase
MQSIGIDVHKVHSQVCILDEEGAVLEEVRIQTDRERFGAVLGSRPRARILIEAGTESEWVARCLEALGHEVIVADPNFAAMYATRSRQTKTDRRDARALADACRLGVYRPVHRVSQEQRERRAQLKVRRGLVETRTRAVSVVRSLLRQEGHRARGGAARLLVDRLEELNLPETLKKTLEPLLELLQLVNQQIAACDGAVAELVKGDPAVQRLCTVPGVGPVVSATFVAVLDTPDRFSKPHQVEAYIGLIPREYSSGEQTRRGRLTKAGSSELRSLLVQSAWSIWQWKKAETKPLWRWAEKIAQRRGKFRAIVALARKLAGILFAIWRDGTTYDLSRLQRPAQAVESKA